MYGFDNRILRKPFICPILIFNRLFILIKNLINSNFNISDFDHLDFYNSEKQRIEMHLRAKKDIGISFKSSERTIKIKKDELIHTENSHKFIMEDIKEYTQIADLSIQDVFTDKNNWFSLVHYKKK